MCAENLSRFALESLHKEEGEECKIWRGRWGQGVTSGSFQPTI
jgi:hypothetical protein